MWENSIEMYITIWIIYDQCKFDVWSGALKTGALGPPRGTGWGGRWEGVQDCGTHVHPWLIQVKVWQNPQCCKVISLQLNKLIFKKLFIFNWRIIAFQYCVGFCHMSTWISHRHTYEPPFHLPPYPTPLGCHRALGSSSLCHTANSHRLTVLHMVMCIFQCYSIWPTLSFSKVAVETQT